MLPVKKNRWSNLYSTACVSVLRQVSLHQPLGEDESLNNQLAFSRSTSASLASSEIGTSSSRQAYRSSVQP